VWDPMNVWGKGDPLCRAEVQIILEVFFEGDREIPVYVWREGDPLQRSRYGCSGMLLMAMAYLSRGLDPGSWTDNDEGVLRGYIWHCLLEGRILDPPRCKLL
jgi:hypothetical protein